MPITRATHRTAAPAPAPAVAVLALAVLAFAPGLPGLPAPLGLLGPVDLAGQQLTASATMIDTAGRQIGQAGLTETPNHGVLIRLEIRGLEPGTHAFHIHETGACDAPEFASAGGHYAPRGNAHGPLHPHGKHGGDLLNIEVPESGAVVTERLAEGVTLLTGAHASLFDDDGSALVIHATADDYQSQPAGGGGAKVACGVIR